MAHTFAKLSETLGVDLSGIIDNGLNKMRATTDDHAHGGSALREMTASHSRLMDTTIIDNSGDGDDVHSPGRGAQLSEHADGSGERNDEIENMTEEDTRNSADNGASSPPRTRTSPRKSVRARRPVNRLLQDNVY